MRRRVIRALIGYALSWLVILYAVLIAAVRGPIDWPVVAQAGLIFGPFGAYVGIALGVFDHD